MQVHLNEEERQKEMELEARQTIPDNRFRNHRTDYGLGHNTVAVYATDRIIIFM